MKSEDIAGYLRRIMPHLNNTVNIINSMAVGILELEKEVIEDYKVEFSDKAKSLLSSRDSE